MHSTRRHAQREADTHNARQIAQREGDCQTHEHLQQSQREFAHVLSSSCAAALESCRSMSCRSLCAQQLLCGSSHFRKCTVAAESRKCTLAVEKVHGAWCMVAVEKCTVAIELPQLSKRELRRIAYTWHCGTKWGETTYLQLLQVHSSTCSATQHKCMHAAVSFRE